jgi:hypothetical protein
MRPRAEPAPCWVHLGVDEPQMLIVWTAPGTEFVADDDPDLTPDEQSDPWLADANSSVLERGARYVLLINRRYRSARSLRGGPVSHEPS